jgi:hypothetical protein
VVLPGGVTGFWDRGDEPLTVTDVRAFRGHCHDAARRAGGRVVSVTRPNPEGLCRNFAVGVFALPAGEVAAVLNAHHPLVAFADPPADGETSLRFRDCPELAAALGSFGVYRVASAAELEQPPTPAALGDLSEVEREQVAYWEPQRVGDVVFNWWG